MMMRSGLLALTYRNRMAVLLAKLHGGERSIRKMLHCNDRPLDACPRAREAKLTIINDI